MEGGSGGQESVRSKRPSGGRVDPAEVIAIPKRYGTRPGSGLGVVGAVVGMSEQAERRIKRVKVGKGRSEVEVRFFCLFCFCWGVATLGVDGRQGDGEGEEDTRWGGRRLTKGLSDHLS